MRPEDQRSTHIQGRTRAVCAAVCLIALLLGDLGAAEAAGALDISNRYSPKDRRRPKRPHTRYIVLHTTEGGERSSLSKVRKRGEAHYFVTRSGRVYRVIHKSKIAKHAGRSMWNGRRTLNNHSIGIEVVGYHNKDITKAQYRAVRELLRQLQSLYGIPDRRVLTHSMVAYGRPNRFHNYNHRGRKRCAMIFARHDVRERLGLLEKPLKDPDVNSGRLRVADRELFDYLFAPPPRRARRPANSKVIAKGRTAWDIAREEYDSPGTTYIFPDGKKVAGDQVADWGRIPPGTRVEVADTADASEGFEGFRDVARDGTPAARVAGAAYADESTIYFLPNGWIRTGSEMARRASTRRMLESLPAGTRVLVGYIYGGHVRRSRLPAKIAGEKWNYPSTFYRFPDGRIVSGDEVDASAIPANTLVFYQA